MPRSQQMKRSSRAAQNHRTYLPLRCAPKQLLRLLSEQPKRRWHRRHRIITAIDSTTQKGIDVWFAQEEAKEAGTNPVESAASQSSNDATSRKSRGQPPSLIVSSDEDEARRSCAISL